jgi:antitoxin YefM
MNFTQHIEADNLTSDFLDYVKKMFKGKKIKLTIETELDDTAYLMASQPNHQRLLKSIKNVKKREKLVRLDKHELKKLLA